MQTSDRAPAPLPPDAARDRLQQQLDDRLPGPDRPDPPFLEQAGAGDAARRHERRMTQGGGPADTELRQDPLSGRLVVVAPARSKRPGAFRRLPPEVTTEELDTCPFCAGREERTPPESLRLPAGQNGWQVRVVPNLYPAFAGQEVVIHTPRHCHFLADLDRRGDRRRRGGLAGAARPPVTATCTRSSTSVPRRVRPFRTRTPSSSGSTSRRPRSSRELRHGSCPRLRPARRRPAVIANGTGSPFAPRGPAGCRTNCLSRPSSTSPIPGGATVSRLPSSSPPRASAVSMRSRDPAR